jgi:uncharacterized protein involved in exopolysaccharide biosynthesis
MNEKVHIAAEVPRFLRRWWLQIAVPAVVAGVAAALALSLFVTPQYEAAATLVIMPLELSSELAPPVLSVQGYRELLGSDAVVAETARRLRDAGVLEPNETLELGSNLRSEIFVSRRAENEVLAPFVKGRATADDPVAAAEIVNTWTAVFRETSRDLRLGNTREASDIVETQFANAKDTLEDLTEQRIEAADQYAQLIDAATLEWNQRISSAEGRWEAVRLGLDNETEDLVTEYQTETRTSMMTLAREEGWLATSDRAGAGSSPARVSPATEAQLRRILSLRIQLAQTPELLVLEKAISDPALWEVIALDEAATIDGEAVWSQRLQTQEINPAYSELVLRLSSLELEFDQATSEQARTTERAMEEIESLQRSRNGGLTKLIGERTHAANDLDREWHLEIQGLRDDKRRALDLMRDQRDARLAGLDREIEQAETFYGELGRSVNEAKLATTQEEASYIRVASPAVPPDEPVGGRTIVVVLSAVLIGALLGILVSWFREAAALPETT